VIVEFKGLAEFRIAIRVGTGKRAWFNVVLYETMDHEISVSIDRTITKPTR
jgi:hypothetical protein